MGILNKGFTYSLLTPLVAILPSVLFAQSQALEGESPRKYSSFPSKEISVLVVHYQYNDRDANFTFFRVHVDSFSTSPKYEIANYALPILENPGLPNKVQKPKNITTPITTEQKPKPTQDLDKDLSL